MRKLTLIAALSVSLVSCESASQATKPETIDTVQVAQDTTKSTIDSVSAPKESDSLPIKK